MSSPTLKVAAYTGGVNVPSARFRVRQNIPFLQKEGVYICEFPAKFGAFPPLTEIIRPFWAFGALSERSFAVLNSYNYDITLLQREMISTLMTLEPFTKRPRVFDVDDAIWIHRNGKAANRIASLCDLVICGNSFLADYFSQWNNNISIIPTAVDTEKYLPLNNQSQTERVVIGWSGSSPGLQYLYEIERSLSIILNKHPNAILRIVADSQPCFKLIPLEKIEYIKWSPEVEVQSIQTMTVGIMPLRDSVLARGKCSFKMLTYMACSIPVVVSPIGMNKEILSIGEIGYGPDSEYEWIDSLSTLLTNQTLRTQMGDRGREIVLNQFSIKTIALQIAECLKKIAR